MDQEAEGSRKVSTWKNAKRALVVAAGLAAADAIPAYGESLNQAPPVQLPRTPTATREATQTPLPALSVAATKTVEAYNKDMAAGVATAEINSTATETARKAAATAVTTREIDEEQTRTQINQRVAQEANDQYLNRIAETQRLAKIQDTAVTIGEGGIILGLVYLLKPVRKIINWPFKKVWESIPWTKAGKKRREEEEKLRIENKNQAAEAQRLREESEAAAAAEARARIERENHASNITHP